MCFGILKLAMKLLCICDPTRYLRPSSDVPLFYQRLALDPRIEFFHLPLERVWGQGRIAQIEGVPVSGDLSYAAFQSLGRIHPPVCHCQRWISSSVERLNLFHQGTSIDFGPGNAMLDL